MPATEFRASEQELFIPEAERNLLEYEVNDTSRTAGEADENEHFNTYSRKRN